MGRRTRWTKLRWALMGLVALLLTACSTTQLAYKNLDWLIPWTVDDYFDLKDAQAELLDRDVEALMRWHCSTELPRYVDWIGRVEVMLDGSDVKRAAVKARFAEFRGALQRILETMTPPATTLLGSLEPWQITELRESLAEGNEERAEEYLEDNARVSIQERAERFEERLEDWSGPLTPAQQRRIMQWAEAVEGLTEGWLDNRKRWQAALLEALERRDEPGFGDRIRRLFQDRASFWTPEYRRFREHAEHEALLLTVDLLNMATPEQRAAIKERLGDLSSDFEALTCTGVSTTTDA